MTATPSDPIIQMANITKIFPNGVVANDNASLTVWPGTIHAIIGENGAGKTTLMNVLYGRFPPDSGRIRLCGEEVRIKSPAHAIALGIGMVTQHTTTIPALSALDNVILGAEPTFGGILHRATARKRIAELDSHLGLRLDWDSLAGSLSVAALQKVEIVKALYREAKILILDEPTSTLAPQEAEALFALIHSLAEQGTTILFVTHKLQEVMAHSHHVTVLSNGRTVAERVTTQTDPQELLNLMIGHRSTIPGVRLTSPIVTELGMGDDQAGEETVLPWERGTSSWTEVPDKVEIQEKAELTPPPVPVLEIRRVSVLNDRHALAVREVTLNVAPGELVGVAGVDGSGQRELAEAIVGLRPLAGGSILFNGIEIDHLSVAERYRLGLAYVPEDRSKEGLIKEFTVAENLILGYQRNREYGGGILLNLEAIREDAERTLQKYHVRVTGADAPAWTLSGGNQQKVILARALESDPHLLVAMQPTRGLDVESTRSIYASFREAQARGMAVLLFSLDIDEIFEVSHRIAVMYNGSLIAVLPRAQATREAVGRRMLGQGSEA